MQNQLNRSECLYTAIVAFYGIILLLSNLCAIKLFQLPFSNLIIPVGLLSYPITFVLGDLVTELFGKKKAHFMIGLGFFLMVISTLLIRLSIWLPSFSEENQKIFEQAFGLTLTATVSSLTAFLVGQLVDIHLYQWIRKQKNSPLWMRSLGSTLPSQLIDSTIVCMGLYFFGMGFSLPLVLQIITFEFGYKLLVCVANVPLFSIAVKSARKFLAKEAYL